MKKPEFNNGFITALALFYGHREQFREHSKIAGYDMRIYGASDHLLDIQYPENLEPELKEKVERFVNDVISLRLERISQREADELFDRCLEILKEIDEKYFGLKVTVNYP